MQQQPGYGQPQPGYGQQPQYGGQPQYGAQPAAQTQPQYTAQPTPTPSGGGVATADPQELYTKDPEQYRTCGIVTSLVFTIIVLFGNIIGLASNMMTFESDSDANFAGAISHYDAKFIVGEKVIYKGRIDDWDKVPPLGDMASNYEWSSAMIILSLLLSIPIIIIQILRLCRKLRHRKLWTYLTGTLSIVNVLLMLISYGSIYSSTQDHLPGLNAWLLSNGGVNHVRATGSSGFVAVILFSYICSIVLFAFGVRTCVGRKCQDGCCCDWCTCNLAEDATFKGAARRADAYRDGAGAQGDPENARTGQNDVYGSNNL